MMIMKRSIVSVVAVFMTAVVLAGCAKTATNAEPSQTAEVTEEPAQPAEEVEPAEDTVEATEEPEVSEEPEEAEEAEEPEEVIGGGSEFCFSGTDVNGNAVNTAEVFAKNKVTVVNIWASWCPPCVGEIPELDKMNKELSEKGCGVIGLLDDGEDPQGLEDAKDILQDVGATYLNMIFPYKISANVAFQAYPTTFFVDSNGTIIGEPVVGAAPDRYREMVDTLLSNM